MQDQLRQSPIAHQQLVTIRRRHIDLNLCWILVSRRRSPGSGNRLRSFHAVDVSRRSKVYKYMILSPCPLVDSNIGGTYQSLCCCQCTLSDRNAVYQRLLVPECTPNTVRRCQQKLKVARTSSFIRAYSLCLCRLKRVGAHAQMLQVHACCQQPTSA